MGAMFGGDDDDYGDDCDYSYSEPQPSFKATVQAPSYGTFAAPQVLAMAAPST